MQIANNPLFIEDLSVEANEIIRGTTAKRDIIVINLGDKKADIDIWIAVGDTKSEALLRWCTFSRSNPLRLEPKEKCEVTLFFEVPPQANPGLYNYDILIEAPFQYPDKLFRRPQQLRVSRSDREGEWDTEPGFTLQPLTSSTNPYLLQAGDKLGIKVIVENRSKRVDRFYLACPELTHEWYSVRYPESSIETAGVVQETDGLQLNPGNTGEITLLLHPPQFTLAGNYFPTVRLISSNREDLVLLDVVYLQLLSDERLDIQLRPFLLKIPTQDGRFEVELTNQGNITREIAIAASDREELFSYTPEFPAVLLTPKSTSNILFKLQPRKWWRRPFWGKALEFNFDIGLENNHVLLRPEPLKPSALPKELPQGTLIWEPRPWWQFLLPFLLLLLVLLGMFSVGAFLLWQKFLVHPKIDRLEPVAKVYQEIADQPINLNLTLRKWRTWEWRNWKIKNISKLSTVKIIPQSREGTGKIISYSYNDLLKFCQPVDTRLNCKNIPTETKKAGEYTFQIEVYSQDQNKPADTKETDTIAIQPIDTPTIIQFYPSSQVYRKNLKEQVVLSWKISHPDRIQNLILTQQSNNASPVKKTFIRCNPQNSQTQELTANTDSIEKIEGREFLVCQGIATNVTQPGNYIFKLEVFSKQNPSQASDTKQTDTITIQASPVPKVIGKILPNKSTYEYQEPVFLSWQLTNPSQIKELKIVQQGSDGSTILNTLSLNQCDIQRSFLGINQQQSNWEINQQNSREIIQPNNPQFIQQNSSIIAQQNNPGIIQQNSPPIIQQNSSGITEQNNSGITQQNSSQITEQNNPGIIQQNSPRIIQRNSSEITRQNNPGIIQQNSSVITEPNNFPAIEPATNSDIAICENIPVIPTGSGSYTYRLEVFSAQNPDRPSDIKEADTITVNPLPVPKIAQISSTKPFYEAVKNEEILLSWQISNAYRIKELRLIGLAADGSVNSQLKRYPIINNSLPQQLINFCTLITANLICQNLPTGAKQAGDYTFRLTVLPKQASGDMEIARDTPTVKIKPVPPKPATPVNIIYFRVNGQDVSAKPKYVYEINKYRKPVDIIVSWKVEDGEDIKVELLPVGDVQKPEGARVLTLSKPPSSVTITLRVTNKAGEQKMQSIMIDTIEPSFLTQPQTPVPGGSTPGETAPGGSAPGGSAPDGASPSPSNPDRLSPIELPPKPD
jgi:hypothetical protein